MQGKSCFDYFHPEEVPFARSVHSRGVLLDKAAVLHYCRILSKDGQWVSCECCFTIVHDVLVACTSIYRQGERSQSMCSCLSVDLDGELIARVWCRARNRSSTDQADILMFASRPAISHAGASFPQVQDAAYGAGT